MYVLPLKIVLPPSNAITIDIRQELGRGVSGVVVEAFIDGRKCALKLVLAIPNPHIYSSLCLADYLIELFHYPHYQFQMRNLKT